MSTGPEHYDRAEKCRARAAEAQTAAYDGTTTDGWEKAAYWNAAAQVHATLALAAATVEAADQQFDNNYRRPLVLRPTKADDVDGPFPGSPWGRVFYGDLT